MKTYAFIICTLILTTSFLPKGETETPTFINDTTSWADSILKTLTPQERIAQLFMVAAYSNKGEAHVNSVKRLVKDYKIGGLIFFQGGPLRQAKLSNEYQALAEVPLLISIDAEWGLAMRLDSTTKFPRQMTLGAIQNDSLVYHMGAEIARQCKRMGMQVNLAPVVDVNNNPKNPVIGNRSFGENKFNVAQKALMYMKGMQDNQVMANAKHFPGHGDTDSDSHKTLPTVKASRERLNSLELYPFKVLMENGLASVMVAHLYIPALDKTPNQASTLTKSIVTGMLKEELDFKGLIFTDALNMKGVSKYYKPGVVDVKALIAGNDVLLFSEDVPTAITQIKAAIAKGEITQAEVDSRCKKILLAKKWSGVVEKSQIDTTNLYQELNTPYADALNRKLTESSLTILRNKDDIIPLKSLETLKIATLSLGKKGQTVFQNTMSIYAPMTHYSIDKDATADEMYKMIQQLKTHNLVIVQLSGTNNKPYRKFGLTSDVIATLNKIIDQQKTIVTVAESPYILDMLSNIENADGVIMSYENNAYSQSYTAQLIFGGIGANGKLPITANKYFNEGDGINTTPNRLKYTVPEELGANSETLLKIDSIAYKSIEDKVFPGCQVLVVKNSKVIYNKSFGYHTYDEKIKVKDTDLYDIASITKIAATTASVMKMVDDKKLKLDNHLCDYLPMVVGTNKENVSIREMMTHQAGLKPWIPFWYKTVEKETYAYKEGIYDSVRSKSFPYRVADKLYMQKDYTDTVFQYILDSKMTKRGAYKYSDLGYYFLNRIIETQTGVSEDAYVEKYFYKPLGLSTMGYHPRNRFDLDRIVPTEDDKKFRKQLVHGDVHDPGAAMFGGVGGHAGVFSNANDLAVIMQMFLNNGEYGGERYIDSTTMKEFTKCQYCKGNRRAIGFDKPEMDPDKNSPVCGCVSYLSFGHSGFTGTLAWADPANDLVYIFLSNRVTPSAKVNKLARQNIRTKIQEVIYEAVN